MVPASATPQPPSDRPDPGDLGEPGSDATLAASEVGAAPRKGSESGEPVQSQGESYGPLSVERQIKPDGRALILYARLEPQTQ